tara:strand:- start:2402 stop:2665 length:264 start_codon:yes stop_codon:yes gene_type:complete
MKISLSDPELAVLFDPAGTEGQGGFQILLASLQSKTDRKSGVLTLTDSDLEKIHRYAFQYKNGGWQKRLKDIFARNLGDDLLPSPSS